MKIITLYFFISLIINAHGNTNFPDKLSELNIFIKESDGSWDLNDNVYPYELNIPLFSDYAQKLRTLYIPQSQDLGINYIRIDDDGNFDFPIGTIISKTFYYSTNVLNWPKSISPPPLAFHGLLQQMHQSWPIETRILIKNTHGWEGVSYQWDYEQNDAYINPIGAQIPISFKGEDFNYYIPDKNQCIGCHLITKNFTKTIVPIGPKQQNFDTNYPWMNGKNQIDAFKDLNLIDPKNIMPNNPSWPSLHDKNVNINERARAYLHINCAHCHSTNGPAKSSGLFLDYKEKLSVRFGVCKAPVAAGNAGGGHPYVIYPGKAKKSLLIHRMKSSLPQTKMPEIGRTLVHKEGVEIISKWINQMQGSCSN